MPQLGASASVRSTDRSIDRSIGSELRGGRAVRPSVLPNGHVLSHNLTDKKRPCSQPAAGSNPVARPYVGRPRSNQAGQSPGQTFALSSYYVSRKERTNESQSQNGPGC